MAFLFTVIPTVSSNSCASLPFNPVSLISRSNRWLSVPPEIARMAVPSNTSAIALAFFTTCSIYSPNAGWRASWNATALPAITCSSGPPWIPGKIALFNFLPNSSFAKIKPPRGPRNVLCVVDVTTSA